MAAELQNQALEAPITDATDVAAAMADSVARPDNPEPSLAPKRQRRPSVRLGEIGDQHGTIRAPKSWKLNPHSKSSKIRPLTNLVNGGGNDNVDGIGEFQNPVEINGNVKRKEFKGKRGGRGPKRLRTNWTSSSRIDETELAEAPSIGAEYEDKEKGGSEPSKDFTREDSEGSPINSADNLGIDTWHAHNRRSIRSRIAESHDHDIAVDLDVNPESGSHDRRRRSSDSVRFLDDGVKNWLIELGLGKYAPVFEIHEVDEEVLPFLTLEDLKDMGINAVGSRRKMYSAIQKLQKGIS